MGLDAGTGNGKYLSLPLDRPGHICTIGLDRSRKLLEIARIPSNGANVREVVLGNVLDNPWRVGTFVSSKVFRTSSSIHSDLRTMPFQLLLSTTWQRMRGDVLRLRYAHRLIITSN